ASGVDDAVALACDNHIDLVIGTTGWNDRLDKLRARVDDARIGCVYASNFSPGANAVFALSRRAGELFAKFPQYAAGIEERHHAQKKDAPSGTALRIAAEVKGGSGGKLEAPILRSRVGGARARSAGELFAKVTQHAAGIEERHHAQKKDAPSGTALRIAAEVKGGSGGKLEAPIVSSRVGSEFGLHTLFFDSPDDLIEISHRA